MTAPTAAPAIFVTRKYDRDGDWYVCHVEFVDCDGWLVTRSAGGAPTHDGALALGTAFVARLAS